jgi:hypothetical protein
VNVIVGVPAELLRLPCRAFFDRVFSASPKDPTRAPASTFLARL